MAIMENTVTDNSKRKQIKEAARRLFLHFGFNKTNMTDIARQCGLTKPALYYYYDNKQSLFQEILLEEASAFMTSIEKKLNNVENCAERLERFYMILYEGMNRIAGDMPEVPDVICEHAFHGAQIAETIQTMQGDKIRPILQKGQQNGEFKIDNLEMTVRSIVNMTRFLNLDWVRRVEKKDATIIIKTVIRFILSGLKGDMHGNGK